MRGVTIGHQLEEMYQRYLPMEMVGEVRYHPPDIGEDRHRFGLAIAGLDGSVVDAGDGDFAFPLQSICKVFTYGMVLEEHGRDETLRRVGVEPSGDPFQSFSVDERNNKPFNPMVNAGALVVVNMLSGRTLREKVQRVLERLRIFAANPNLEVHAGILEDELVKYSDRNLGLSYLLRSMGMLHGDVHENIEVYLSSCSIRVTVRDLAVMGATLANGGINPITGQEALSRQYVRDVITVMTTCGMYDAAGEWAYDVGIPAKSSVSGAILLAMPRYFGGAIFSPPLDAYGTSVRGVAVCRELSQRFGLHMFGDPVENQLGNWDGPE